MRVLIGYFILCISLFSFMTFSQEGLAVSHEKESTQTFKVGVLANHGVQKGIIRWQATMDYLSEQVPGTHFEVVPVDFDEMSRQLLNHEIQFIVTNPGQYLNLSGHFPLSWLATMKSVKHDQTTFAIGSTIIVRADSQIYTLKDLAGKHLVASDPQALGGYQAAIGLFHKMGYNPETFFGSMRFLGFPLEPLVYQVRDKTVDAAITPFCTLEEMIDEGMVNKADFRVIHPTVPEGSDCFVSTQLYPNWSFASADTVSPKITQEIAQALYDLPAEHMAAVTAKNAGWTAPISQFKVIQLFKELQLKIPPPPLYETVLKWMQRNKEWGIALLFLFLVSTIYHLWLEYKFREKSEYLLEAERQLKDKALQVERMQSAAILGEIGSGLAHELNQPIAAITQYSEGGMMQLNRQGEGDSELYELLAKVNAQSVRAGAVVHRIRRLLQRRTSAKEPLDMNHVVNNAVVLFKREFTQHNIQLSLQTSGEAYPIQGDEVGMSQVLVNLLKNSFDAMNDMPNAMQNEQKIIAIKLHFGDNLLSLTVIDNGPGLQGDVSELMASFYSTKEQGLGLGLAICRDVVAQHGGELVISNCSENKENQWSRGCVVTITIGVNDGALLVQKG